uniref:Uncharacterized protein n=1 Tax=Panagrolaimus sp. PS1159 TaxID=55785 RepID=A0AC35FGX8_9BILA
MGNRPTSLLPQATEQQGNRDNNNAAAPIHHQPTPSPAAQKPHPQPSQTAVHTPTATAISSTPTTTTAVNPLHQYEKPHRRKVPSSEGYSYEKTSSSSAASSSSSGSTNESRDGRDKQPTQTKKRRRKKRNLSATTTTTTTTASREQIIPPSGAKATPSKEQTIEAPPEKENDKAAAEPPLLVKRKRYKNVIKPKEDNTEFEKVKVKARPAASKKHLPGANKNNIERLMANNNSTDQNDQEPQLKSFEESEEECGKPQKIEDPASDGRNNVASDTGAENTDTTAKSKEKISTKDETAKSKEKISTKDEKVERKEESDPQKRAAENPLPIASTNAEEKK